MIAKLSRAAPLSLMPWGTEEAESPVLRGRCGNRLECPLCANSGHSSVLELELAHMPASPAKDGDAVFIQSPGDAARRTKRMNFSGSYRLCIACHNFPNRVEWYARVVISCQVM